MKFAKVLLAVLSLSFGAVEVQAYHVKYNGEYKAADGCTYYVMVDVEVTSSTSWTGGVSWNPIGGNGCQRGGVVVHKVGAGAGGDIISECYDSEGEPSMECEPPFAVEDLRALGEE